MLLRENGPFRIFRSARESLGVTYYEGNDGHDIVLSFKYEITTCIWCLSMWVAALVGAVIYFLPQYALYLLIPHSFSAVAIFIDQYFGQES